jgi:hypothetical protein
MSNRKRPRNDPTGTKFEVEASLGTLLDTITLQAAIVSESPATSYFQNTPHSNPVQTESAEKSPHPCLYCGQLFLQQAADDEGPGAAASICACCMQALEDCVMTVNEESDGETLNLDRCLTCDNVNGNPLPGIFNCSACIVAMQLPIQDSQDGETISDFHEDEEAEITLFRVESPMSVLRRKFEEAQENGQVVCLLTQDDE